MPQCSRCDARSKGNPSKRFVGWTRWTSSYLARWTILRGPAPEFPNPCPTMTWSATKNGWRSSELNREAQLAFDGSFICSLTDQAVAFFGGANHHFPCFLSHVIIIPSSRTLLIFFCFSECCSCPDIELSQYQFYNTVLWNLLLHLFCHDNDKRGC